jgi:hypothetical protein
MRRLSHRASPDVESPVVALAVVDAHAANEPAANRPIRGKLEQLTNGQLKFDCN